LEILEVDGEEKSEIVSNFIDIKVTEIETDIEHELITNEIAAMSITYY
jgi:hypothetical protein